jgi:cysteine desulfurase
MRAIYFDNAATSPVSPEVLQAMWAAYADAVGNPASLHLFGQKAKRVLDRSRQIVARAIGADARDVYFTSGGTESDNLAIKGIAHAGRERGRHIITSPIEHHAVLNVFHALEREGFEISIVPVDRFGVVDLDALQAAIRPDTTLISIMLANNEVGTIEPIKDVVALAHDKGISVHTDAVQAVGKISVNVNDLGVDALSLTAHKFYGPKGQGALYVRNGTPIVPLFRGGHQERELRPGTENVPGIVGLAAAIELVVRELDTESVRLAALRDRLESGIRARVNDVTVNGHPVRRVPNITNLSFAGVEGEALLLALDMKGIAVSTGSACNAGSTEPSHVLRAMDVDWQLAQGSLRFSLGRNSTVDEVEYVIEAVGEVADRLREVSPLYQASVGRRSARG